MTPESIDRLKAQLLTSGLSQSNQALFQIINTLIEGIRSALFSIKDITGGTSAGGSGGIAGQTFLTVNSDVATLPNSSQIIAGNGIVFNRVANRLIISVAIPIGIDGQDGEQGPIGPEGPQGIRGPAGAIGPPGLDGEEYVEYFPMSGTTLI